MCVFCFESDYVDALSSRTCFLGVFWARTEVEMELSNAQDRFEPTNKVRFKLLAITSKQESEIEDESEKNNSQSF